MSANKENSTAMLALRITVVNPPPDLLWALQLGQAEAIKPTSITPTQMCFDFTVEALEDSSPAGFRLRGPAVQGRPGGRFVYLRIGAYAGQTGIAAGWRAKIGLEGINRKLITAVRAKRAGVLEVQIAGCGPKGGPACATVPLLAPGWHVA